MMAEEVGEVRAVEQGKLLRAVFGDASPRTTKVGLRGVPERALPHPYQSTIP